MSDTWKDNLFAGKRAVVTGVASGIGRAVAQELIALGAEVVAVDLSEAGRDELGAAHYLAGDLTDAGFRAEIARAAGTIDFLVNVAGYQRLATSREATEADWDILFDVNAKAPFFLTRDLEPSIADGGRVVFFSSVAARFGRTPETVVYAAAKTAVLSLVRNFAYELGKRGICVNAILPGTTNTPMQDLVTEGIAARQGISPDRLAQNRLGVVALDRPAEPPEIAAAVIWLLSPAAGYVTGQGLAIDGGFTMA